MKKHFFSRIYSMERTAIFNGDSFTDDDNAYFEINQKMSLRSKIVNLSYDLYAEVGDYYYSDGTWLSNVVDSPDKYCIGLVFHTGQGPEDKIDYYSDDQTFVDWLTDEQGNRIRKKKITGYVLALHDAKMDKEYVNDTDYPYYKVNDDYKEDIYVHRPWKITFSDMGLSDKAEIERIFNGYLENSIYSGHYVCKTLYPRLKDSYQSERMYKMRTLPYQACIEYNDTWADGGEVSTPPGSSGWYLPSLQQIYDAYRMPHRKEKIAEVSTCINRIEEVVSDFVMDEGFVVDTDKDATVYTYYNTISRDLGPNLATDRHMLFDPSPLTYWYVIIYNKDFEIINGSTPPTRTRPILTF